ncbi:hypothetical protein PR003_g34603 [Phytophthora rubi]|uniref:Uncharacterized protein n=1 Tax=Phytophthora rubi TaxID=129364 RepID=A0A6A3G5S5_9STRA|nr:hypothetical protein PR001_g33490 [Phytophthora rubi]KAE9259857.1 hypothetical protein PR003_g34603 [Phytophthora rubi]
MLDVVGRAHDKELATSTVLKTDDVVLNVFRGALDQSNRAVEGNG